MKNFSVRETAKIDGGAYRWVEFPDGSARVEGWGPKGWTPGGATFWEFLETPPVSPKFAAELGIPLADVTIERAKPKEDKPPENLTAKRLREAIDLGVKMAEADALLKLTMKARQVRAAELERRLIANNRRSTRLERRPVTPKGAGSSSPKPIPKIFPGRIIF